MAQYDINLREYWRVLKKRKLIIIVTAIVLCIFSTSVAIIKAPVPLYSSVCSIKFERGTPVEGLYNPTISWSGGDDIQTQIAMIKSNKLFERVAVNLRKIRPGQEGVLRQLTAEENAIVQDLQSKMSATREAFTNIINIEAKDPDARSAQELAKTVAETYQQMNSDEQLKRTLEAIAYITEKLNEERKNLKDAEEKFNTFSQANKIVSIEVQSQNLLNAAQLIQADLRKLLAEKAELKSIRERLEQFQKKPLEGTNDFYSEKASHEYQAANNSLVELMVQRRTLLEEYTAKHPELVANGRKIVETANKMDILLRLQIEDMHKREAEFQGELVRNEIRTKELMDKKMEFDRLKRAVELHNDMTTLLERKNQEMEIRKAERPQEVTIIKYPVEPTSPINPPQTAGTAALGILIGIVLGMVAAFIAETFDTSLGAIEDVEASIGAPVLGVIPETDPQQIQEEAGSKYPEPIKSSAFLTSVHLVTHFSPKSMMAETFRALRTNIQFKDMEKKIKSIAITSASPQEGKTVISINLAITMAQAGVKTLLVGSDMRKPMLARVFGVEEAPGLTDILLGNYPWRDTVKGITDLIMGKITLEEVILTPGLDNLHIITGGTIPPNPAELIESKNLMEFMSEAQKEYDLILFDSPPIISTADAIILGTKVDGVLMVYRLGSVSQSLLKRAVSQLTQVNSRIMGVVLNGMRPEISPDFHDAKYYKYYHSYGNENKDHRIAGRPGRLPFSQKGFWQGTFFAAWAARLKEKMWLLILLAVILLVVGLLWQSGIFDLFQFLGFSR